MELAGTCEAVVVTVRPYEVHGQPNWVVLYSVDGAEELEEAHLAAQSVYPDPAEGDEVFVDLVLGQAVSIRRR